MIEQAIEDVYEQEKINASHINFFVNFFFRMFLVVYLFFVGCCRLTSA